MQPTFNPPGNGYDAELLCPSCGGNFLHHDRFEAFECNEDQESGIHVVVECGKATINQSLAVNPSGRRHGLSIHFWCEGCSAKPVLTISQNKGNTLLD